MTELRVTVPDDVAERLASAAAQRGSTTEDIAAAVLTQHVLAPVTSGQKGRRPGFVGIGRSGRHDLSERAEEILRAEFGR